MTQLIPFVPQPRASFEFQPVLDGQTCTAVVSWNLAGQRWYVTLYDQNNARVLTLPVVASPDPAAVASAAWDGTRRRVVATTAAPHGLRTGTRAELTFAGFAPVGYDGVQVCDVLGPSTLAFAAPVDPGAVVVLGTVCAEVALTGGYFASRLVFRGSARRFEISP